MSFIKCIYSRKKMSNGQTKCKFLGMTFKYGQPNSCLYKTNLKLGVSYSVWDGEELLEGAIRTIRPEVDYINVVWQRISWHGAECDPNLEKHLLNLREKGLIDEIVFFDCDPTRQCNQNECDKRNLGLQAARRAGCTHFMTADTDEYWDLEQFKKAKRLIYEKNITHSACFHVRYFEPTVRETNPASSFLPFIYRIDNGECFQLNSFLDELPWRCDPTRQIPITKDSRICFLHDLICHHFCSVRKDLMRKIKNSSANHSPAEEENQIKMKIRTQGELEKRLSNGEYVRVKNKFGIKID